jgi:hypothetical protein
MIIAFPRSDTAWVEANLISIGGARLRRMLNLSKLGHLIWKIEHSNFF